MLADGLGAAVRAEFAKMRSLRAAAITLLLVSVISLGISGLGGWSYRHAIAMHSPSLVRGFTAAGAGFDGILYGQLAAIVFAVLLVTCEYGSGMIKLSLLAMPRRGGFYTAKMAVIALTVAAAAIPATALGYALMQAELGPYGASIAAPGVPRAMVGAVGYLALISLLAAGLAVMTRNAIVPLATLLPVILAGSQILSDFHVTAAIARFLPDRAGMQMIGHPVMTAGGLSPVAGLVVLLAWAGASLAGGYLLLRRRDA
jgi:ABC-2 type transport system permease protein